MRVILVDDEKLALEAMRVKLTHIERISEVHAFLSPADALDFFTENGADAAFLDISMAGMDGLALAERMRELRPGVIIIFITGYAEYSLDAFRLHADGYLMKPMDEEDIERELDDLVRRRAPLRAAKRIRVQCFGNFEVFADDMPLTFKYAKTKELFAYLIDRKGATASTGELVAILWEDRPDTASLRSQLRNLITDLSHALKNVGAENVLVKVNRCFGVNTDEVDCDYYDFMRKERKAISTYNGEYMLQFSWAEMTAGSLTV